MTFPSLSASHRVSSCCALPSSFFFFPPNPTYAFIITVTWWRSARKGVAQRDLPLFVSIPQRLLLLRPPISFFFSPQPELCLYNHGDLVEERTQGSGAS